MRVALALLLFVACGDQRVVSTGSDDVTFAPRVDFPPTAIGFPRVRQLTLTNRARTPRVLTLTTLGPFTADRAARVAGGAEVTVDVTFVPEVLGAAVGELLVDGVSVELVGEGVPVPDCGASTACASVRFDAETLSCVTTPKGDGEACDDLRSCIEGGTCRAGACVGRVARCDDADACTSDSCAVGRGCQHTAVECAAPTNPCQAATCDATRGCGAAPVVDGTPCGPVSCETASVCLAGQCRTVTPPEGFVCAPASACRGEGVCRNKVCDVPAAHTLTPRWSYTASSANFHFEGVTDEQGNWYWVECSATTVRMGTPRVPVAPGHRCLVHSRTSDGFERFVTEVTGPLPPLDVQAGTQVVAGQRFIFPTSGVRLAAVDVATGAIAWTRDLAPEGSQQSLFGLAADTHGDVWVVVRRQAESEAWQVVKLDGVTGAVLGSVQRDGAISSLSLDGDRPLFVVQPLVTVLPDPLIVYPRLERLGADGGVAMSVELTSSSLPVMTLPGRVVLADDSVINTIDGGAFEGPSHVDWRTEAPGVSTGVGRVRVAKFVGPPAQLPPSLPPQVFALQTVDASGARARPLTFTADRVAAPFLTASGDALVVSSRGGLSRGPTTPLETRVRQVHPLGLEVMSCELVERQVGTSIDLPVLPEGTVGFNGRVLAVRAEAPECPVCDLWAPPHVVFYDLGRPAPGVAARGWVAPRGTVTGAARAR